MDSPVQNKVRKLNKKIVNFAKMKRDQVVYWNSSQSSKSSINASNNFMNLASKLLICESNAENYYILEFHTGKKLGPNT